MRTNLWRIATAMILLAMLISPIAPVRAAPPAALKPGLKIVEAAFVGVSQPLRSITPIKVDPNAPTYLKQMQDRLVLPKAQNNFRSGGFDASIVQKAPVTNSSPAPIANFEGVNNVSGVLPPDTQGDIGFDPTTGKKYYIQWVNLAYQIWDVTNPAAPTALLASPTAGNTLWAGTGTICAADNDGDPITQFDHLANRWMMSQFALGFPNDFHQCIAVSATADPMGTWYLYDFQTSTVNMNDYPHFGVWPDGYYMTVNQFNGSTYGWAGAGVAVFERTAMLAGLPARMIYIDTGAVTLNYGGMLPSDLDGPAPAAGTPNYFMEWDDSTWLGDAADTLRVWEFKTDWAVPANTTFGLNASYDPNLKISTANVDPDMCGGARNCVPQPGTAQGLDAIADRLMYRLQYRDFGSYQTLVGNHTVDSTGTNVAGIHWFELRDTGSGFAMRQESVYVGDTPNTDNRWMGSAAMDSSGDIALGYSVSNSSTVYPSIRYTGRLAADPLNVLSQGETSLIAGGGSQTHSAARWGDYSMLAVDPADGCTFWYTQEYIQSTGSAPWQTRVGSFKFPSCTALPTGSISGTVTDSSAAPVAGATVGASGGYSTITDGAGHYELTLVAGSYDVTVSKYGYVTQTALGVTVTPPATTTHNFSLVNETASTISGKVTDSTTGWPLYARIDIFGYPYSPIFTDPVTGDYSVNLVNGSYTFTVSAMSGGYKDTVLPLAVSGSATQNFGLNVDDIACNAPGYAMTPPSFAENFETWPLTGWTIVDNIAGGGLTWDTNSNYGEPNNTGGAGTAATVSSDNVSGNYDTELVSPVIDPNTLANKNLVYKANYQQFNLDAFDLDIRNAGDPDWTNILHWVEDHGALNGLPGETVAVDLTPYVTGNFQLRWHYYTPETNPWDWYAQFDEVGIGAGCSPVASSGLIVGSVFDLNTSLLVKNALVQDAAFNSAILIDSSADPATPAQLYVIAETAGTQTLTASAPYYGSDVKSPVVVAGGTVKQNLNLPAGILSAAPTSLTFTVPVTAPNASKSANLSNTGSAPANYEIFAIPGQFAGYNPTGPFAPHTRHFGPMNLSDKDAKKIRLDFTPKNVPIINGGEVSDSFPTGLDYAWGIGFNTEANDMWLGNIAAGGGDDLDYRFLTNGTNTGDTIDTSSWVGVFAADMTYNPFTNMLWQVNVGGDNCIYEMDPATKMATGNKICPAFGTSERGLAFDPSTNTYYSGSWNDGIINHFAPNGTLLDSKNLGLNISGLAFNPSTGHLFVMTNATNSPDVYVVDVNDSYNIIGAFYLTQGATKVITGSQAGLEADCDGNLWAVNQATQIVYKAASGETGFCNYQASWLQVTPSAGAIANGGHTSMIVSVNATGLKPGVHKAYLRIVGNTPYGDSIVPVTLKVKAVTRHSFKSLGAFDGWILESLTQPGKGGTKDGAGQSIMVGDNADNKQYRAILHFYTAGLPNNAIVTSATLKMKKMNIVGKPQIGHGALLFDIRKPFFGVAAALDISDFQAHASKTSAGKFSLVGGPNDWYVGKITSGLQFINLLGTTQFRLRFSIGNDHDSTADYMEFYSGNAPIELRPYLIVEYYVP